MTPAASQKQEIYMNYGNVTGRIAHLCSFSEKFYKMATVGVTMDTKVWAF